MSPRETRYERNQSLFREVNERIVELAGTWSVRNFDLICECANTGCTEIIHVPLAEYARVRERPGWFMIAPGHVGAESEHVVERHADYEIVKV